MAESVDLIFNGQVRRILVGLSWDLNEPRSSLLSAQDSHDLDLYCVLLSEDYEIIDMISPMDPKREKYKSQIFHTGDHKSGASELDDEEIHLNLDNVTGDISHFLFMISSKSKLKLSKANKPYFTIYDGLSHEKLYGADLSNIEDDLSTGGVLVAAISRNISDWMFKPLYHYLPGAEKSDFSQFLKS